MDSLTLLQMLMAQQNEELEIVKAKILKLNDSIESIESIISTGHYYDENAEVLFRRNLNKTIVLPYRSFQPMKKAHLESISFLSFPDFSSHVSEEFLSSKNDVINYRAQKKKEVNNWKEILEVYVNKHKELEEKKRNILKFLDSLEIEMELYLYNSFTPNMKLITDFTNKTTFQLKDLAKDFDLDIELHKDAELINRRLENDSHSGQHSLKSIIVEEVIKNFKNKYIGKVKNYKYYLRAIYRHLKFDVLPDKNWPESNFISFAQKRYSSVE